MIEKDSIYTLSEYERLALASRINLSDGHARHTLTAAQRDIVGRTLELFDQALIRPQHDIEAEFLSSFFQCAGQPNPSSRQHVYLNFSSSSAIKIAAQMCRVRGLTVYLVEPCFDNIVHMLRTENVPVCAVYEEHLTDTDYLAHLLTSRSVLWLTQPNNPTGFCLDRPAFNSLLDAVARQGATLIVDYCFRFYADGLLGWDQYSMLRDCGVSFLSFEDTGKTWPLADTKAGITICSADNAPIIYRLHDELLLNVSPLHLLLLIELIKHTLNEGLYGTVRRNIETNRRLVHTLLEGNLVAHATQWCHNVPMELLRLPHFEDSTGFWESLRLKGIDVLPAENYFWSHPQHGHSLFRIPLSRPCHHVEEAIPVIRNILLEYSSR